MGTPLGDFLRAKRDSTTPDDLGIAATDRRRAPGLRRSELATRAGMSVEYLTRIEQGGDRNPSGSVLNALCDALQLNAGERTHLRYLAKISGGACAGHTQPEPPTRDVRPTALQLLDMLEPGVAMITNRLGDVLAHTSGFDTLMRPTGLLDTEQPNLTRFVFTDPRARSSFAAWDQVADEQVSTCGLVLPPPPPNGSKRSLRRWAEPSSRGESTGISHHDSNHYGSAVTKARPAGFESPSNSPAPTPNNSSFTSPRIQQHPRCSSNCAVGPAPRCAQSEDVPAVPA